MRLPISSTITPAVIAYMSVNAFDPESVPAPRPWSVAAPQTAKLR
jgi:hypothetical protein